MQFKFSNVNEAFKHLVTGIQDGSIPTEKRASRAGDVLSIPEPVLIEYTKPYERVLFNGSRDANPFFHVFESLWMLAGHNDVKTLKRYSSTIEQIASDDGKTFNGAYGYRWRQAGQYLSNPLPGTKNAYGEGIDQLDIIINHLKENPDSRRAVLQMWNVEDDLLKIDSSKDVCCNTAVYFSLRPTKYLNRALDMTVTNRSNDLIWGCLGANVVHFSFLQEYVAMKLGAMIGSYYQFTNNLHVYEDVWNPSLWLSEYTNRTMFNSPVDYTDRMKMFVPLYDEHFDQELRLFLATTTDGYVFDRDWRNGFISKVAYPMFKAFNAHKTRNYLLAKDWCKKILADDWKEVCYRWISKREKGYQKRNGTEAK